MHRPYGKTKELMVRISPGAFSWNHGVVLVLRRLPQANASRPPPETELRKILSSGMLPLAIPAREMSSITSGGLNASRLRTIVRDWVGEERAHTRGRQCYMCGSSDCI